MTEPSRLPGRCYVIAEAGSNHDGDLGCAHGLVDAAADAEVDAVKFQLFTADEMYPSTCGEVETPIGMVNFFELLRSMELPPDWLPELRDHADARGIDLLCTPFDVAAVARLDALELRAMKVASPELTDHVLLRAVAATGRSVILSTGMSTLGDVEESVAVLRDARAGEIALLQCVTAYPTPLEQLELGAIPLLAEAFDARAGLSDHSREPVIGPAIAVALGGSVLEKHITLSRADGKGPDHPFAIEPDELKDLVSAVRTLEELPVADRLRVVEEQHGHELVEAVIGSRRKVISPAEAELAACDRRSIHSLRAIDAGEVLDETNIRVLRGERNLRPGLHPRHLPTLIGAHTTRPVAAGDGVVLSDLLAR